MTSNQILLQSAVMAFSKRSSPLAACSVFTDVFNKNENTQVPLLDRSAPFMDDIVVSKDGVINFSKA